MIKTFIKVILISTVLFQMLLIASCNKLQKTSNNVNAAYEVSDSVITEQKKYNPDDGLVCILFGEDFTEDNFYQKSISQLSEKYGLSSDGGIILPIRYPDDLKSRISNLYDIVTEHKIKGIILLGAPEGTHKPLYRLRSQLSQEEPPAYSNPIFSLMPQDDILGQESTCDFILEYERTSSESDMESEISLTPQLTDIALNIVIRAVRYIEENTEPLSPTKELRNHVQTIVGEKKVRRYTDPETGLQAINHFVIEQ